MKILIVWTTRRKAGVYLIDTNVISETRKKSKANPGVLQFFQHAIDHSEKLYISVITIGELRRGVCLIRYRGDARQADQLEKWLETLLSQYRDHVLDVNSDISQVWGALRVPHPQNALDKQIAATALIHELTVVTRKEKDFVSSGVPVLNPFQQARSK
jgi:predicted nucleic acid-binding protein